MARARRGNKRPWGSEHRPLRLVGGQARGETAWGGRSYQVQRGIIAKKTYHCPGCSRPIPTGTTHVVAWPDSSEGWHDVGIDERRHWHTYCWDRGR